MANQVAGSQTELANKVSTLESSVTSLNSKITPSITLVNGFLTSTTEYTNSLTIINHIAILHLMVYTSSTYELTDQTWNTIATIPQGYRPLQNTSCMVSVLNSGHSPGNIYDGRILANGWIQIYAYGFTQIAGRAVIQTCYAV